MSDKKRVASITDPVIVAATGGLLRFKTEAQARAMLERIRRHYILSKEQDELAENHPPTLRLWIRGYALSAEEQEAGYRGHFARIAMQAMENGRVTLVAEKILIPLDRHPQKMRPQSRYPNRGHPILRAAQKAKLYPTIEAGRVELALLHEEFPEATLPGPDALHVMVYNRKAAGKAPIDKIVLHVKELDDGRACLALMDKTKKKPARKTKITETTGKFTLMLKKQRRKKGG